MVLLLPFGAVAAPAAPSRPAAEIRKEMAAIRRSTDWGNPAEAQAANERIAKLAEELAASGKVAPDGAAAAPGSAGAATADPRDGGVDGTEYRNMLTKQIAAAVGQGEHGDILLATSVREKIVEEYRDDVNPQIKNPDVFNEQTTLIIDLSSPAAPGVIAQMENFQSIKTLVITGGKAGAPVDLPTILHKAAGYPLQELYIINFQHFVTALPSEISQFKQLRLLAAFNNAIAAVPPQLAGSANLETLLVDINPIRTVLPTVRSLPKLARLGIARTAISAAERTEIQQQLPHCSLLTE